MMDAKGVCTIREVFYQEDGTITSFADATIPALSWLWVTTSDKAGSPTELALTFDYNEDG